VAALVSTTGAVGVPASRTWPAAVGTVPALPLTLRAVSATEMAPFTSSMVRGAAGPASSPRLRVVANNRYKFFMDN